jgi:hypothetical protein
MANAIPVTQNSEEQLNLLAASSYFSSRGKLILGFQIALTVLIPVAWTFVIAVQPKLQLWAAFYSITISIVDAGLIDRSLATLVEHGAKAQEMFDCNVMALRWNGIKIGESLSGEDLHRAITKWMKRHPEAKRDWYPPVVGKLPAHLGRLVCQRTNCWYDESLRRRYRDGLTAFLAVVMIIIIFIGLIGGLTLAKFVLAILAPMSPALLWGIREYKRQSKAIQLRARLKTVAEQLCQRAIDSPALTLEHESRLLQDEIYDARRTNPSIFNWVYALFRSDQEEQMKAGAEHLVNKFLTSEADS